MGLFQFLSVLLLLLEVWDLPMLFFKTLLFFQALKMEVIVHMQNSRWRQ